MGTPHWSWQIAYWGPFSPAPAFFQLVTVFCILLATIQMRAILGPHFTDGETEAWSKQGSGSETPSLGKPCSCSPSCDAHAEVGQGSRRKVTPGTVHNLTCTSMFHPCHTSEGRYS